MNVNKLSKVSEFPPSNIHATNGSENEKAIPLVLPYLYPRKKNCISSGRYTAKRLQVATNFCLVLITKAYSLAWLLNL